MIIYMYKINKGDVNYEIKENNKYKQSEEIK